MNSKYDAAKRLAQVVEMYGWSYLSDAEADVLAHDDELFQIFDALLQISKREKILGKSNSKKTSNDVDFLNNFWISFKVDDWRMQAKLFVSKNTKTVVMEIKHWPPKMDQSPSGGAHKLLFQQELSYENLADLISTVKGTLKKYNFPDNLVDEAIQRAHSWEE